MTATWRRAPHVAVRGLLLAAMISTVFAAAAAPARHGPSHHGQAKNNTASGGFRLPNTELEPVEFADMEGWKADSQADAFATFLASCRPILQSSDKARQGRPRMYQALHDICRRAIAALPLDDDGARAFFETNFRPYRISALGVRDGFITGYYEPVVDGARFPSDVFNVPLYRRPSDMMMSRLRQHRAPKGKAAWRKPRPAAPYFDRAQIEDGAIAGRGLEICYLKDPIDAFFAQVQGSVRVRLEDGSVIRLNYDSANGQPYTSVGRFLVDRGIIAKEDISMQRIREWMEAHPEEGKALRRENKSYVFFRETNLQEFDEAIGAQGLSLTAGRSIAVDKNLHTYGTPFFLDAELPIVSERPDTRFRRLMIAQDTGGAIVGPARADIYLGTGDEAARPAGRFKQFGRFVMLIPKEINPAITAKEIPLPKPRPVLEKVDPKAASLPAPKGEVAQASATPLPRARPNRPAK
jgi:membrane-bound lytic murein transglycosylase A